MKICISSGGRFHSFYLAHQINKHGHLSQIITTYPKFFLNKYINDISLINSFYFKEIYQRFFFRLPTFIKNIYNPQFFLSEIFDKFAEKRLKECDIFIGWSSFSERTLLKAKNFGAKTVIERGSTHILFQNNILKLEYEKNNIKNGVLPHPRIIEKELREYDSADFIMVPSTFAKRTFIDQKIEQNKILNIPYGVDLHEFYPQKKIDSKFRIIFCGSVSIRKGSHYLIRAFQELNLKNAELWFVGDIQSCIKSILNVILFNPDIKFFKPVPQKKLRWFYNQSNVFVLPSLEEGMPTVLLQAMACSLPIICSKNSGGGDLISSREGGFVLDSISIEEIKKKILYMYENIENAKIMGKNNLRKVQKNYTWDSYGSNIISTYKKIISEKL
ncbi:RfaG Glycosyltransferase [Candidatus Pelagibacterales bacterium]